MKIFHKRKPKGAYAYPAVRPTLSQLVILDDFFERKLQLRRELTVYHLRKLGGVLGVLRGQYVWDF